jgi:Flp pilus assembly pilin Flp
MMQRFIHDDQGQDLIEYILLGSFIALVAVAGATALGTKINTWYNNMSTWVNTQATSGPLAGS